MSDVKKRVLIVGATGFIGPAIVEEFSQVGFEVVCGVRDRKKAARQLGFDHVELIDVDLNRDTNPAVWFKRLKEIRVDGVVNNGGIANTFGGQSLENVNFRTPVALFKAVRRYNREIGGRGFGNGGIRLIQISTTGVDWPDWEEFDYPATKKRGDEALMAMEDLDRVIIRPNVVYEPERGHLLLEQISRIAIIFYIYGGFIQPIFCRELAMGIVRIMNRRKRECPLILHACGPEQLTWEMIFFMSRRALGGRHAIFIPVPLKVAQWFTMAVQCLPDRLLCHLGILSKMDPETILMMTRGSICESPNWSQQVRLRSARLYDVYRAYKKGPAQYMAYLETVRTGMFDDVEDTIECA